MKRLFVIAFVAGFLAVALAATFWPLPQHLRFRSISSVSADGGRQEDFVIHWPEDRIARPGEGQPGAPAAVGVAILEDSAGRRVSAELFRVRDAEDNVIGVASRLAGTGGASADQGRSASNWLLVIPSRGTLFLAQSDSFDTTARDGFAGSGATPGQVGSTGSAAPLPPAHSAAFWGDQRRIRVTAPAPAGDSPAASTGKVLRGTSEFAGLEGSFTETWDLEEAGTDGSTRGRIHLSTLTAGGS